jgi:membrane fusion protein (multidrug efflux system)
VDKQGKVESRYIKRGEQLGTMRIITEGLSSKDSVIVDGIQRARPGIQVKVVPAKGAPESSK